MSPLRVHLLGRFEVLRDGVPIPQQAWRRRRPADLLKLVALSRDHRLSREQVIDTLWPDKEPSAGANNLHRALYDLRLVLGGRHVDMAGCYVVLAPSAWVDVDAFEEAVARGGDEGRRDAVALYRGELSPEDPESPWLRTRRALLRTRFAEVAGLVAQAAIARGDRAEGAAILRRLLAADPAAEEAHRLLMELLARVGSREEALRQYDEAARALRAAGRGQPGEPLRTLRDAIDRREIGPPSPAAPLDGARRAALRLLGAADPPPLRGREAQLQSAAALLDRGSGVLILLGEPGVGATRLALELARMAQERGATVLAGAACTLHPAAPFGPFAAAFADEARESAAAVKDPFEAEAAAPTLAPDATRRRLFAAVADALAGGGRPIFLLLDDLHAADESSLDLLHDLASRAPELRLTVVGTCHEGAVRTGTPIQAALARLDADRLALGVRVPRLANAAAAELLGDLLPSPPPPDVASRICEVTDGSPFGLEQVAHGWLAAGRGEVPRDPTSALRLRVARLAPTATRLLAAGAVIGDRFPLELAARVAGLDRAEARGALALAAEARLLRPSLESPRFTHALVREEVLAGLDPARRAELHRAVAKALEAEGVRPGSGGARPDQLAWHWLEGFDPRRAWRQLLAAGHRAAECSGLREALAFHEQALRLDAEGGLASGEERFELLEAVGRDRLALGELAGAADSLRTAATMEGPGAWHPAPSQRARVLRLAAMARLVAGDVRGAHRELEEALATAGDESEEPAALHLLRARLHWHTARFDDAAQAAEAACGEAERIGHPELLAQARDLLALANTARGEPIASPVERHGPADRRRVDPLDDPALDPSLLLWDSAPARDVPALELLRMAGLELARSRERGDELATAVALFATGTFRLALADAEGAEGPLREALATFRERGIALGEALALERLATLEQHRGRVVEGWELLAEGMLVSERAPLRRHLALRLLATQARNRLATGSLHAAEVLVRQAADEGARHGRCATCELSLGQVQALVASKREETG